MKTIIKWPGGKTRELKEFEKLIPTYDRYVEPFLGGGAVFFHLEPPRACINDISTSLIDFYNEVKNQSPELKSLLLDYSLLIKSVLDITNKEYPLILKYFYEKKAVDDLVRNILRKVNVPSSIVLDELIFENTLIKMVLDKFNRTIKNQEKRPFSNQDLSDNLKTGFVSGIYIYFRDIYNSILCGNLSLSKAYKVANFYFIREYCYGSMFRYNSKGEFNIPYGGISYNKKDFTAKIENIFNDNVKNLFANTIICNKDFEEFIYGLSLTEHDFMFLDPPYDTDFSDYEGRSFDKEDQERLAKLLLETKAKFILVIKNTDFIYNLYKGTSLNIYSFEKNYTYNVRSRNNREVEHLIITNLVINQ